jgi:hypothetical protein
MKTEFQLISTPHTQIAVFIYHFSSHNTLFIVGGQYIFANFSLNKKVTTSQTTESQVHRPKRLNF